MTEIRQIIVGQRVRINEQEDPPIYVGKMAVIEQLGFEEDGEPTCLLKIDRVSDPVYFPPFG